MDIFLFEAAINGLLLAGVLALLTLGLNLIFGVIDVVWIAYADLVMCGMYAVYWLFAVFGWPLPLAFAASVIGDPRKSSQFSFSPIVCTTSVSPTHFPLE